MTTTMPTNIVFDFGAVLVSWRPELLLQEQFPDHAPDMVRARDLAAAFFHHADWHAFDRGTLEQSDVVTRTAQRLRLPQPAVQALVEGIAPRLTPIAGTIELLEGLYQRKRTQGDIRLYFLSNMPQPYARYLERAHGFMQQFDGGVFSGDAGLIKPQGEIYALLEQRYGLQPQHTVFIDDLLANVVAARARGWRGIHFESPAQLQSDLVSELV